MANAQDSADLHVFLASLSHHIKDTRVSVSTDRDHTQAKDELMDTKMKWLESSILYEEVKDMVLGNDLQKLDIGDKQDQQMSQILSGSLAFAEITAYIDHNRAPHNTHLLGVTDADVRRLNPHRNCIQTIQQKYLPQLEENLRMRCETLLQFNAPARSSSSNEELKFAQSTQLPAFVEADQRQLESDRAGLKKDKMDLGTEFWKTYEVILQSLEVLEVLVNNHKITSNSEHNRAKTEWFIAKCDALTLKIRCLELQMMCEMYNSQTMNALHAIKRQLDDATDVTKQELQHVSQILSTYTSVGMGFDELVAEYSHLKKDLDNKEWALNELNAATR